MNTNSRPTHKGQETRQFIGRYYHALEQKGRLSIPAAFREKLGGQAILTLGFDGCLFLFPLPNWQEALKGTANMPFTRKRSRDYIRWLTNSAVEVEMDGQGRILVPAYLKERANLEKRVVVVGSLDRIEIWNQEDYHQYLEQLESQAEEIAESLGESPES